MLSPQEINRWALDLKFKETQQRVRRRSSTFKFATRPRGSRKLCGVSLLLFRGAPLHFAIFGRVGGVLHFAVLGQVKGGAGAQLQRRLM